LNLGRVSGGRSGIDGTFVVGLSIHVGLGGTFLTSGKGVANHEVFHRALRLRLQGCTTALLKENWQLALYRYIAKVKESLNEWFAVYVNKRIVKSCGF